MKIQTKLVFLFIISVLACNVMFSQKNDIRQPLPLVKYKSNVDAPLTAKELAQIKEVYGDKTQSDVLNHPQRVKDIKHILRNRVKIVDAGVKDLSPLTKLSSVGNSAELNFNPTTFNPLKYNFHFYSNSRNASIYHVDNTSYYIIIKSQYE